MDAKLHRILSLALHPNTGQAESMAALSAARRLVSHDGLDKYIGESIRNQDRKRNSERNCAGL